jgi:hypothetical protein
VCRVHGGKAPQVLAAARLRILMAADPIAARLITIARSTRTKPSDAIVACREILNRAGISPQTEVAGPANNGQVLWEEFVAIYRRRAPNALQGETT